jgi:signal transduction histidine kinase
MNEQERLRRRSRVLHAAAAIVALLAVPAHLLLIGATSDLSVTILLLDPVVALVLFAGASQWIETVTTSRRRAAALAVLPRELAAPRSIEAAASDALEALEAAGVATAGAIGLAGSASGEMRLAAAVGFPADFHDSAALLTLPSATQGVLAVEAALDHPWGRALHASRASDDVTATAPLVVGEGESLGLLLLAAPRHSVLDVPLISELAGQLAGVVDHAALYEASFQREQELEEQEARRSEFMSAISHEIRTPLTSIQAFAEILSANPANLQPGAAELVQSLSQAVDRLRSLVDELIELGRGVDVDVRAELRPLDIGPLLRAAVSVVRPALVRREQAITIDLASGPLVASVDEDFLRHVVLNLLSNANRHTPQRGAILLRAGVPTPGRVRIEVTDSGPGVDPADRDRIFEPYYRVHRSGTSDVPGAGLGLAIARRYTELQGGRIWVDAANSDGTGARFSVELEAASVPAQSPATFTVSPARLPAPMPATPTTQNRAPDSPQG